MRVGRTFGSHGIRAVCFRIRCWALPGVERSVLWLTDGLHRARIPAVICQGGKPASWQYKFACRAQISFPLSGFPLGNRVSTSLELWSFPFQYLNAREAPCHCTLVLRHNGSVRERTAWNAVWPHWGFEMDWNLQTHKNSSWCLLQMDKKKEAKSLLTQKGWGFVDWKKSMEILLGIEKILCEAYWGIVYIILRYNLIYAINFTFFECMVWRVLEAKLSVIPPMPVLSLNRCVLLLQLCPTLCNPMDCSPPGSSVHEISQPRVLEWVARPSRGSSRPRDWTRVSLCLLHCRWALYH